MIIFGVTKVTMEQQILGAVVMAIVVVLTAGLAGLWSTAVTDTIGMAVMMIGASVALLNLLGQVDGFSGLMHTLASLPGGAKLLQPLGGKPVLYAVGLMLLSVYMYADVALVQRYAAARSPRQITTALAWDVAFMASFAFVCNLIGLCCVALTKTIPKSTKVAEQLLLATYLKVLPPGLKGAWLAAFIAAAVTSANSYLLAGVANIAHDIYRKWIKPLATDKEVIRLMRILMVIISFVEIPIVIIWKAGWTAWVWGAWLWAATAFVPMVIGPPLAGRRLHRGAAFWSMLVGAICYFLMNPPPGTWPSLAVMIGLGRVYKQMGGKAFGFLVSWAVMAAVYFAICLAAGGKQVKKEVVSSG